MSQSSKWARCYCGSISPLFYIDTKGECEGRMVTVAGVPSYYCNVCEDSFMDGEVSSRYRDRVREATKSGLEVIWYDKSKFISG